MTDPVLALSRISKKFGSVQALSNVDLVVGAGEVVALVGDNGAGKSTLVKVIAGVGPADSGEIRWEGDHVSIGKPHDATALGIATVYQDLSLCDNLDVVANLFLGNETVRLGMLDEIGMERTARDLLLELSVTIRNPRAPVSTLSGGERQSVAIARAMLDKPKPKPKLVILDEPTAALGVEQTAQVLTLIEKLRDKRLGVILISHNLTDVQAVADRVVVLRLGHNAGEFLIEAPPPGTAPLRANASTSGVLLTVTGLTTPGASVDVAVTNTGAADASTTAASIQAKPDGTFTLSIQQHSPTDVVTVTTTIGNATGYLALLHPPGG